MKKEWEQAPLHDLLQLSLVEPQRSLHHFVVEADGELLQLAALLVGGREEDFSKSCSLPAVSRGVRVADVNGGATESECAQRSCGQICSHSESTQPH